jgi:hypothetical protein
VEASGIVHSDRSENMIQQSFKPEEPSSQEASPRKLKCLDTFCGMGGVSDGFALEGFDVTGIDIVDAPKMLGYKHRFIMADMLTLDGRDYRGFDVIWGSPPCRDFCIIAKTLGHRWKEKPNPKKGMVLIETFLNFVKKAKPKFWIMENSALARQYIPLKPRALSHIGKGMRRVFYGNFPLFLMPRDMTKKLSAEKQRLSWKGNNKMKSWERAKIPLACSRAFASACKEALQP